MEYIDALTWVRVWREAGPRLEAIRREELRRVDIATVAHALDGAFRFALRNAPPRATSGLIEQQRLFALLRP